MELSKYQIKRFLRAYMYMEKLIRDHERQYLYEFANSKEDITLEEFCNSKQIDYNFISFIVSNYLKNVNDDQIEEKFK